jgi:hypothetical protein
MGSSPSAGFQGKQNPNPGYLQPGYPSVRSPRLRLAIIPSAPLCFTAESRASVYRTSLAWPDHDAIRRLPPPLWWQHWSDVSTPNPQYRHSWRAHHEEYCREEPITRFAIRTDRKGCESFLSGICCQIYRHPWINRTEALSKGALQMRQYCPGTTVCTFTIGIHGTGLSFAPPPGNRVSSLLPPSMCREKHVPAIVRGPPEIATKDFSGHSPPEMNIHTRNDLPWESAHRDTERLNNPEVAAPS